MTETELKPQMQDLSEDPVEDLSAGLVRWIRKCNQYDLSRYFPFYVGKTALGWVAKKDADRFASEPNIFIVSQNKISLHPRLTTTKTRNETLAFILYRWKKKGWVTGWRNEFYRASTDFHQEPLFVLERSASQLFGLNNYGVHLNGYVRKKDGLYLWIAKRDRNRPRFPGMLDHIVAGGLTAGETAAETLVRECAEEAAIPESLASQATATGLVTLFMEEDDCIKRDVIFTYDLELPESFVPHNTDGEVENFKLWPVKHVMEMIAQTDKIKLNCNLVMIDFLVRHGFLTPENRYYSEILAGLRAGISN